MCFPLPIPKGGGSVRGPRCGLFLRLGLLLGALVLLYANTLRASASAISLETDSGESHENATVEGFDVGSGFPPPTVGDATSYGSYWQPAARVSSSTKPVREPSGDHNLYNRRPARKGGWYKKTAAGLVGLALVIFLWLGWVSPRPALPVQLDEEAQAEPDVLADRFRSLYSGSVDLHKAQKEAATMNAARLTKLANDAAELVKHLDIPEAKESLERLYKSIQDTKEADILLLTPFHAELSTTEAVEVANTTYVRAALDMKRQHFEDAIKEAKMLQKLAGRFIAEVSQESESLVASLKEQQGKLIFLSLKALSLPLDKARLRAHTVSVSNLYNVAAKYLAALQSLSASAAIDEAPLPTLSLSRETTAVQTALKLRSQIRDASTEAADWMEDAETNERDLVRNFAKALYMQTLAQRLKLELSKFILKPATIPQEHMGGVQKYLAAADDLDNIWKEVDQEYSKHDPDTSAVEMIESAKRTGSLLKEAAKELLQAPLVTASLVDFGTDETEKLAFDGVPVPLPAGNELTEARRTKKLRTKLANIAALAVDASRILLVGRSWDPLTEAPKWAQRYGIEDSRLSHKLKAKWRNEVASGNFSASNVRTSFGKLLWAQERPIIISAAEETVYHASLAMFRSQEALNMSVEGKAWERFERAITNIYNRYETVREVTNKAILDQQGLSKQAFKDYLRTIYEHKDIGFAAQALGELKKKLIKLEQIARTRMEIEARYQERREATALPVLRGLAATQGAAGAAASAASEVVARATVQARMLASKASEWQTKTGVPEAGEAAQATGDALAKIEACALRFHTACDDLKRASTDSKLRKALLEVMNTKEEIMRVAHAAHFSYQKAALALHQGGYFRRIWRPEDDPKPRNDQLKRRGVAEVEAALSTAMEAGNVREQLMNRVMQELRKAPLDDQNVPVTENRLHEETGIVSGFIMHMKTLIKKARTQPDSGKMDKLLAAEARSCLDMIVESALLLDTMIYDMQNSQDAAPLAPPLPP